MDKRSVVRVAGNVKVGCDVEIGEKTLIVGPNGSGKSTVINTIELALTGRAGDIAGRVDVGREADVMSLATGPELEALVTFDDGVVAAYRTSGSTAKAKKATGDRPSDRCHDEVLPIRSLRDAVLGSAVTARKYLLSKASGGVSRDNIRALIPEPVAGLWDKLVAAVPAEMATPDLLVHVLEEAGKRQRAANDEAKGARGAGRLIGEGIQAPPSEAEVAAARKAHAAAKAAFVAADRASGAQARLDVARAKIPALEAKHKAALAAVEKAREALDNLPPEADGYQILVDAIKTAQASVSFGECLVCNGDVQRIPGNIPQMQEAAAAMQAGMLARRAAHDDLERAGFEEESAEIALMTVVREVERLEQEVAQGSPMSVADAEAALDAAQRLVSELESARDNWAIVQRSESVAVDAERKALEWKTLKESCEAAVARVLDRALGDFVAKVQGNLPPTDVFDLRLRDGEREVVQFGLVRDGRLHTALSGAEWARVLAAIADACVPEERYACIIPEERAFDPKTLMEVMKALGQSRHQVVLASPVKPSRVPAGWTVVERV